MLIKEEQRGPRRAIATIICKQPDRTARRSSFDPSGRSRRCGRGHGDVRIVELSICGCIAPEGKDHTRHAMSDAALWGSITIQAVRR